MQQSQSVPYLIVAPVGQHSPVVLSSPHSGRLYPEDLLAQLRVTAEQLRPLEDGPIDELVVRGCAAGATLIAATYPRAVVDLNREASELDPEALLDPAAAPDLRLTVKARAGLGIVPTRLMGEPIYRERLTVAELERRLAEVYEPYHAELAGLVRERRQRFGAAFVLDCHSMPTVQPPLRDEAPVDVALGDRFGRSCHPRLVEVAERFLAAAGLKVARNRPYAGGHITEHYGRPLQGSHALQLELRRSLFMDEASHEPHAGFAWLQELLGELVRLLTETVLELAHHVPRPVPAPVRICGIGSGRALRMA
ncbi:N-formylglutamate amidohydrolase [Benzoatithermus flavus]|uniref:N-formylglutamate amidohydrolase n=1 Tax=Benzoatithermus flavus TaxID=3108223 RepID=A0ABU8XMY1_9PROT